MKIEGEQILLRGYLRTTDQHHFSPVYERIVQRASARKMAGATVLKGILGVGARGTLHDAALTLAHNLPVIVELVDSGRAIADFLRDELAQLFHDGIITLERAHVMMWRHRSHAGPRTPLALAASIPPLSLVPALERTPNMQAPTDGLLLRIFIGESDHLPGPHGPPLYEAVVSKVRELGLKGATVLRGSMGFGANSVLHTSKLLELSTDLPIVIEIVDERPNIEKILPYLEQTIDEGMMTLEDVRILTYRAGK